MLPTDRPLHLVRVPAHDWPRVTVVMPVRNERRFILMSLGAVLSQDYPHDRLDVLVLDGMSNDGTRELVLQMQARDARVRLIDNPRRIVSTALNVALAEARGDIIARVDGHCEIASDYVRRGVMHLRTDGVDGVGGPLETVGESPMSALIATVMSSRFGVGDSAFRVTAERDVCADTIAFPIYTRAVVDRAGGFDEDLVRNQDDEYNYRLRKFGAKLLLARDVRARYYSRASLRSLGSQYFQYGFWKVRVMQKHVRQMRPRQFVPPAFVGAVATLLSLGLIGLVPLNWAGLLLLLYGASALVASALVADRVPVALRPLLPAAFATLHFSYGAGFLLGLVAHSTAWHRPSSPGGSLPRSSPHIVRN